jgi:3-phenylpropionate/trans-cinnamate dioxygenase ferredoxin reductase component
MTGGLVVVGGSYAALHTIASAREHGYRGSVTLVTREPRLPYDRPSLSKSFLTGTTDPARLAMRGDRFWTQHRVTTRLGSTALDVDPHARTVQLRGGERVDYDQLVLCTGSRPRRLPVPGADLAGVRTLRDLDDALALRVDVATARDVVIVGAGFIGLEVAGALASRGLTVTVLEAAPRIMGRVLTPTIAAYLSDRHAEVGVRIRLGVSVAALEGRDRVRAVVATDGVRLPADVVLVGIGATAEPALAESAGVASSAAGVVVDAAMRTGVPGILAAGDCTLHANRFAPAGGPIRLESVQNAVDQGRVAGATVAGVESRYDSVPWFWSDQCGLKLQMAGLRRPGSREVVRGDPAGGRFSVFHLDDDDRVTAVDSINRPAEHMLARRLVAEGVRIPADVVADPAVDLRALNLTLT